MKEYTDAELAARCRAGDQDAWRELVDRFSRYVYAITTQGFRLAPNVSLRHDDLDPGEARLRRGVKAGDLARVILQSAIAFHDAPGMRQMFLHRPT